MLFVGVPRWSGARRQPVSAPAATATAQAASRTIRARIFYVVEEGISLVGVDRDVPYAESPVEQARKLLEAQLETHRARRSVSRCPRARVCGSFFLTEKGEAYVDLSPEIADKHPGGSLEELFTVYAIVNVLTVNLPAVTSVQMLVDGHEVDTLAGHIDLRRPLTKNMNLVKGPGASETAATAGTRVTAEHSPTIHRPFRCTVTVLPDRVRHHDQSRQSSAHRPAHDQDHAPTT